MYISKLNKKIASKYGILMLIATKNLQKASNNI